jgi:hypothetical protein
MHGNTKTSTEVVEGTQTLEFMHGNTKTSTEDAKGEQTLESYSPVLLTRLSKYFRV